MLQEVFTDGQQEVGMGAAFSNSRRTCVPPRRLTGVLGCPWIERVLGCPWRTERRCSFWFQSVDTLWLGSPPLACRKSCTPWDTFWRPPREGRRPCPLESCRGRVPLRCSPPLGEVHSRVSAGRFAVFVFPSRSDRWWANTRLLTQTSRPKDTTRLVLSASSLAMKLEPAPYWDLILRKELLLVTRLMLVPSADEAECTAKVVRGLDDPSVPVKVTGQPSLPGYIPLADVTGNMELCPPASLSHQQLWIHA